MAQKRTVMWTTRLVYGKDGVGRMKRKKWYAVRNKLGHFVRWIEYKRSTQLDQKKSSKAERAKKSKK